MMYTFLNIKYVYVFFHIQVFVRRYLRKFVRLASPWATTREYSKHLGKSAQYFSFYSGRMMCQVNHHLRVMIKSMDNHRGASERFQILIVHCQHKGCYQPCICYTCSKPHGAKKNEPNMFQEN